MYKKDLELFALFKQPLSDITPTTTANHSSAAAPNSYLKVEAHMKEQNTGGFDMMTNKPSLIALA